MKKIFLIAILFLFYACQKKLSNEPKLLLDTITKPEILKSGQSRCVIFPAAYSKKLLKNASECVGFFTPNKLDILNIDKQLSSHIELSYNPWYRDSESRKSVKIDSIHMYSYDKQYLGYTSSTNDSIILINVFNFESDPYKYYKRFEKEFIFGFDGWSNTNTCEFKFVKNKNILIDNMK